MASGSSLEDEDIYVVVVKEEDLNKGEEMLLNDTTGELILPDYLPDVYSQDKHSPDMQCVHSPDVEDLIEVAEKYGTPIDEQFLKSEPNTEPKSEPESDNSDGSNYAPSDDNDDGDGDNTDYLQSDISADEEKQTTDKSKKKRKPFQNTGFRRKLIDPEQAHSYVDDWRKENPLFQENRQELILHVAKMMKSKQFPSIPLDDFNKQDDKTIECKICGKVMPSMYNARYHWVEKHGPRYLNCYACGVDFRSTTSLYKHESRCRHPDAKIVYEARTISMGVRSRTRITHMKNDDVVKHYTVRAMENGAKRFQCDECPASFSCFSNLRAHYLVHRGEWPYKCDKCVTAYTCLNRLKRHMRRVHGGYHCNKCDTTCATKRAFNDHILVKHSEEAKKKLTCPYECGREYSSHYSLKVHVDHVHLKKTPPCPCTICPKRFFKNNQLKVHMKEKHGLILMTKNMLIRQLPKLDPSLMSQLTNAFVCKEETEKKSSK